MKTELILLMEKIEPLWMTYEPKTLDEVVGRDDIVNRLKLQLKNGYINNMLFEGVQGTGKTMILKLLMDEYFKDDNNPNVCEIDASSKSDVETIRGTIISFLKTSGMNTKKLKWLKLEEFDHVPKANQAVLRRPIEQAALHCIIAATCNYIDNIILPIQSRFTIYSFGQLPQEAIEAMINRICKGEGIKIEGDYNLIMNEIYRGSRGELRHTINQYLELARASKVLDMEIVRMSSVANDSYIKEAIRGNISKAITLGLQNAKGCLSGAIYFITETYKDKFPIPLQNKLVEYIAQSYRDITNNIPHHVVFPNLTLKLATALKPKEKKSEEN